MKVTKPYCFLLLFSLCLAGIPVFAQDSTASCVDISKITYANAMARFASSAITSSKDPFEKILPTLEFKKGMVHTGTVPPSDVAKKAIIRLSLCNPTDTAVSVWFFSRLLLFRHCHVPAGWGYSKPYSGCSTGRSRQPWLPFHNPAASRFNHSVCATWLCKNAYQ